VNDQGRYSGGMTVRRARPFITAAVALSAATVTAITPITPIPVPAETRTANPAVRLTADSSSIANIPINLFYAFANVPHSQVQALNKVAGSLFFTGSWLVGSSTNIWGQDPADPGHWEAVTDLFFPFPALSGPAGQQLGMYMSAQYVSDASCDALTCAPLIPLQPITGITFVDKLIWWGRILSGYPFPILENMFRVPTSELLAGYEFGQIVNPAGPVNSYFGFEGTHPGPNGEPLMPWSGTTFTLDPLAGWKNFLNSLMAPPPSPADAIKIPSGEDLSRALWAVLAGFVVGFNPFIPGSIFCPGECAIPDNLTTVGIVKTIAALSPGNKMIQEWLELEAEGKANGPTPEQVDFLKKQWAGDLGIFKFNPDTTAAINAALKSVHPELPNIALHSGLLGGLDAPALLADIARLLGIGGPAAPSSASRLSGTGSESVAAGLGLWRDVPGLLGTLGARDDSTILSGTGSQSVAPRLGRWRDIARGAVKNPMPTAITSTDETREGNSSEPHPRDRTGTFRRGLGGTAQSVISKIKDGLKGGSRQTGGTGNPDGPGNPDRRGAN
jgi:hypothetical protein